MSETAADPSVLSELELSRLRALHERTGGKQFEPKDMRHPFVVRMIEAGMMAKVDGGWMWERTRDSDLVFTVAAKETIERLAAEPETAETLSPGM